MGEIEVLKPCQFRTLDDRGFSVCFWQESYVADLDTPGAPNHLTLRQARSNFQRRGTVNEWAVDSVLVDGPKRYAKEPRLLRG